jgi:hypothetical protein
MFLCSGLLFLNPDSAERTVFDLLWCCDVVFLPLQRVTPEYQEMGVPGEEGQRPCLSQSQRTAWPMTQPCTWPSEVPSTHTHIKHACTRTRTYTHIHAHTSYPFPCIWKCFIIASTSTRYSYSHTLVTYIPEWTVTNSTLYTECTKHYEHLLFPWQKDQVNPGES